MIYYKPLTGLKTVFLSMQQTNPIQGRLTQPLPGKIIPMVVIIPFQRRLERHYRTLYNTRQYEFISKNSSRKQSFRHLSGSKIHAFLGLILSPIQRLLDMYDTHIAQKRYELSFNGQVMYLEHILNDRFDMTQRRIYITDKDPLDNAPAIIFNIADSTETAIIYNIGDAQAAQSLIAFTFADIENQYDFILNVPNALSSQNLRIRKTLDQYKEASKEYIIINF